MCVQGKNIVQIRVPSPVSGISWGLRTCPPWIKEDQCMFYQGRDLEKCPMQVLLMSHWPHEQQKGWENVTFHCAHTQLQFYYYVQRKLQIPETQLATESFSFLLLSQSFINLRSNFTVLKYDRFHKKQWVPHTN